MAGRMDDAAAARPERGGAREQILEVAEALFAERGVAETSIRDLTAAAGVNVAAVNYYFGSREALLGELIARRLEPLTAARLALLDARTGGAPPSTDEVLYALAAPALDLCFAHPHFARLASRLRADTDPGPWRDYRRRAEPALARFRDALAAARPDLPAHEAQARLHYLLGAIHHVWSHCPLPADETPARVLASFLTFYGAALRAPAPPEPPSGTPGGKGE